MSDGPPPVLEVAGLHAGYGGVPALHGVTLQVEAGKAVALLGANGAGKSTLLRCVMGLLAPSAGTIRLEGRDLRALRADRRARLGLGYCPEGRRVFPGLTVAENLQVACWAAAGVCAQRFDQVYALFPALRDRRHTPAWQLSGGQQQMVAIGRSLMGAPRLLLLDEPSLGLSPRLVDEVLDRIPVICRSGCAVLLAEQNAAAALSVCDRVCVLRGGMMVMEGSAGDVAAMDADGALRDAFLGG